MPGQPNELLIVYHSMTGGSEQMAQAAARGAAGEGVAVNLKRADGARADDVLRAAGYIFVTPENLASMSGLLKDFFDRTYYAALDHLNGRPYLVLICAGTDGRGAVQQIERIATGWRLRAVAEPLIVVTHASTPEAILKPKHIAREQLARCEERGKTIAAGLSLGIF